MTPPPPIRQIHAATAPLLALNNAHAIELSPLTLFELDQIIRASFFSASIDDSDALLISFDQSYPHQHENLRWLRGFFANAPENRKRAVLAARQESVSDQNCVYVDRA